MFYFILILLLAYTIFTFMFAISSYREHISRAGNLGMLFTLLLAIASGIYVWATQYGFLDGAIQKSIQNAFGIVLGIFTLLLFLPLGRNPQALKGTEGMKEGDSVKFNQKDTAFNIAHVGGFGPEVGKRRWALQSVDPFGGYFWTMLMALRKMADGKINPKKKTFSSVEQATKELKKMAKYTGVDLVGITTIKDDFVYSESFSYEKSGLGEGEAVTYPFDLPYKYVIVLAQEMDYSKIHDTLTDKNDISQAEIGKTYYKLADIACSLASHIRDMGYSAKAHHVRNEQTMQVPHAVDAGLGEQGRHGYLISPKFGPRVRLASVTTDMELKIDKPVDIGVQHFCKICRLCENNCPSRAIPAEKEVVLGYRKWAQNQVNCFRFWVSGGNTFGCSLCLKVCPWNKPRSFVHAISFWAASRSWLARYVLYWIAAIFFGTKAKWQRLPLPDEIEMPSETSGFGNSK